MTNKEKLKRQALAAGFAVTEEKPPSARDVQYTFSRDHSPTMVYKCEGSKQARIYLDGVLAGAAIRRLEGE